MNDELMIPGRDGDHGDSDQTDEAAQEFPQRGDRVDVAVADRGECHDGPPQAVADIGERFGLGVAFDVVHEDRREADHDAAGGIGRDEFFAYGRKDLPDEPERARVADELEDDEDVCQRDDVDRGGVP